MEYEDKDTRMGPINETTSLSNTNQCETKLRNSNRCKKLPVTRSDDYFWWLDNDHNGDDVRYRTNLSIIPKRANSKSMITWPYKTTNVVKELNKKLAT